jgi:serine/threonine protein kinase
MLYQGKPLNGFYRCVELLGAGGISVVWLAVDERFNRKVAIKKLERKRGEDSIEQLEKFSQLFEREAKTLSKLDHDAFPRVIEFFSDWDNILKIDAPCIVMDFIGGESLFEKSKNNPLSLDEVISLTYELLDAIKYLHQPDSDKPIVIHRDIKPENLKYSKQGKLKILDFGLAKEFIEVRDIQENKSYPAGTLPYAPLEQGLKYSEGWWELLYKFEDKAEEFARQDSVPATDIFSIGATLYFLLSGRTPMLDAASRAKVVWSGIGLDPLKPIVEINSNVPPEISQIIHKALNLEIAERYQDVASMQADFDAYFEKQKRLQEAKEREKLEINLRENFEKNFETLKQEIESKAAETERKLKEIIEEKNETIKQLENEKGIKQVNPNPLPREQKNQTRRSGIGILLFSLFGFLIIGFISFAIGYNEGFSSSDKSLTNLNANALKTVTIDPTPSPILTPTPTPVPTPTPKYDIPEIEAIVESFQLFEGGNEMPDEIKFGTVFKASKTRYVWFELKFKHPNFDTIKSVELTQEWYKNGVKVLPGCSSPQTILFFKNYSRDYTYFHSGCGNTNPGVSWTAGKYEVIIRHGQKIIANKAFEVKK